MRVFASVIQPGEGDTVLDVGGETYNWQYVPTKLRIELVNLYIAPLSVASHMEFNSVEGDGLNLVYEDNSFDIGFSNSVIEHVGSKENQIKFASEISRAAKKLFVQTPAREFFLEPHFLTPFVHWLPEPPQKWIIYWFSLRNWLIHASRTNSDDLVDEIRLLSKREMQEMFPDCRIITERFFLMPKSYIAVRA